MLFLQCRNMSRADPQGIVIHLTVAFSFWYEDCMSDVMCGFKAGSLLGHHSSALLSYSLGPALSSELQPPFTRPLLPNVKTSRNLRSDPEQLLKESNLKE